MSWFRDPQLFMYKESGTGGVAIYRLNKYLSVGTRYSLADLDSYAYYRFSDHLSLGVNKESDYAAFLSYIKSKPNYAAINFQGLVGAVDNKNGGYILCREDISSPVYRLPSILIASIDAQQQQKQALDRKVSELESLNSTLRNNENKLTAQVSDLQKQLIQEKSDKQALQKKVSDSESMSVASINNEKKLTAEISDLQQQLQQEKTDRETDMQALEKKFSELSSKLEERCAAGDGSADEEQWITEHPVPSDWVSYDDLDVQRFPKDAPSTTNKVMWIPKFPDDNTTNVHPNRFYRGMFPLVAVNVDELTAANGNARFDQEFWSLYRFAGTSYAARKAFDSEMLIDARKTAG